MAAILVTAVTPSPRPSPQPTNPFTLEPLPATAPPIPYIGSTRSRALCTAFRRAIAPAVQAAMQTDQTYAGFRKDLYDYVVRGTEASRDLMLMRMDRNVQAVVKNTDALQAALDSHDFNAPANAASKDVEALAAIRKTLRGVLEAQKVELDTMNGWVETERMARMGTFSEGERNMNRAVNGDPNAGRTPLTQATDSPSFGFLRDTQQVFRDRPTGQFALRDAQLLDHDLADIAAFTAHREDAATKVIVPATSLCK